jgi:hypothetical protein
MGRVSSFPRVIRTRSDGPFPDRRAWVCPTAVLIAVGWQPAAGSPESVKAL